MKKYKIAGFLLLIPILFACKEECNNPIFDEPDETIVRIGLVASTSGLNSERGAAVKAGFELALAEMRQEIYDAGSNSTIQYSFINSDSKPDSARMATASLHEEDSVDIFFGFESDEAIEAVEAYISNRNLFLLSCGSTSGSLAKNDNIFRYMASDAALGIIYSDILQRDSVKKLITVSSDNKNRISFIDGLLPHLNEKNIDPGDLVQYDAGSIDFSSTVSTIRNQIVNSLKEFESGNIGVMMSSAEELPLILELMSEKTFKTVKWYGGPAAVKANYSAHPDAGDFAEEVRFLIPVPAVDISAGSGDSEIREALSEHTSEDYLSYAYSAYDAGINLISAALYSRYADLEALKGQFRLVSERGFGITGRTKLNEFGDRAFATYSFSRPVKSGDSYVLERVFFYTNN